MTQATQQVAAHGPVQPLTHSMQITSGRLLRSAGLVIRVPSVSNDRVWSRWLLHFAAVQHSN